MSISKCFLDLDAIAAGKPTYTWKFIKKRLQHRCFPVKFAKFLRTPIFKSMFERLLLHLKYYNPANNTAEAVIEFSKTVRAEEEI